MSNEADLVSPNSFSYAQYDGFTSQQCLALPPDQQVDCSGQHLNITDPPSIYTYTQYSALWQPAWCMLWNVTLTGRVDNQDSLNFCTVPLRGSDGILFLSLALLVTACCFGKLASVTVLCIGGILGTINYYANLLQIGNAISIWLAIQPADLFFYAFIPPLVVEETIRLDLFLLRKGFLHVILLAYLLVGLTVVIMTPIILYALNFKDRGWSWVHAALFSAIIAPTDTVAVAAIMASSNAPSRLSTILRGESVFNDASGITFFGIFAGILAANATPGSASTWPSVWSTLPGILLDLLRTTSIGVGIGLAMAWLTHRLLRLLRWRGASPYIDTTVVLAVAYLCYYVTSSPAQGSGVIAVVCFGLYGNATSKWGMLATVEDNGSFDAVWDMVAFAVNGLVFFWSGIAAVNFLIRSAALLTRTPASFIAIPVIYVAMILIRTLCIVLFNPIFKLLGKGLSPSEIIFSGFASMRGAVSLIMASGFALGSSSIYTGSGDSISDGSDDGAAINAAILLWTASFVVITLVVNGSLCGPMLRILNLCKVTKERNRTRARARRSLCEFTEEKLVALKQNKEAEFLAGANWDLVEQYVEVSSVPMEGFDDNKNEEVNKESDEKKGGAQTLLGVLCTLGRAVLHYFQTCCGHICSTVSTGSRCQMKKSEYKGRHHASKEQQQSPSPSPPSRPTSPTESPSVVVELSAPTPKVPENGSTVAGYVLEHGHGHQQQRHHHHRDESSHRSAGWSDRSGAFEEMDWTQDDQVKECPFLSYTTEKERKTDVSQVGLGEIPGPSQPVQVPKSADIESNYKGQEDEEDEDASYFRRKTLQPISVRVEEIEPEQEGASTQSMPAYVGRSMRAELQRELGKVGRTSFAFEIDQLDGEPSSTAIDEKSTPFGIAPSASATEATEAERAPSLTPIPNTAAPAGIALELQKALHGATVSGASGAALAAELKRQLNLTNEANRSSSTSFGYTPSRSSVFGPSGRDLLGRKNSGSASPRPLQFLGFGVNASSPSYNNKSGGGGVFSNSGDNSTHGNYQLSRNSVFSARDRAVLPASAPLAAALLDQQLGALQHRQQAQEQQHQHNVSTENGTNKQASEDNNLSLPAHIPTSPPTEEVLYEEKSRVVSGLKRHFTARRLGGLLSSRGLRLLEYSCDESLENTGGSLRLWPLLEAEVRGGWAARGASRLSLLTLGVYHSMPGVFRKLFSWPLKKISAMLRRYLGRKMLVACEVAIELYLALTSIPQVAWLKQAHHATTWRCLLDDIEVDTSAAHNFIIQREIEAPDMFQAIQSYRSAMAVLRQQLVFCQNLFQNGAVDAGELQVLTSPIDKKIRHLEMVGPVWRPPRAKAVLRSLSVVTELSDAAFRRFYAAGSILAFRKGQIIWDSSKSSATTTEKYSCPGLFIILSGVVKRVLKSNEVIKEYFGGPGGIVGALPCLVENLSTSTASSFSETVVAEGNALDRGPVVFHLPRTALLQMLPVEEFAGLREELMRLAAASLMEQHDMLYNNNDRNKTNGSDNSKIIREMLSASIIDLLPGQTFFCADRGENYTGGDAVLLQGSLQNNGSVLIAPCVITMASWRAGERGATIAVASPSAAAGGGASGGGK